MHREPSIRTRNAVLTCAITALFGAAAPVMADAVLLEGSAPAPIEAEHFPSRLHTFIWRNWESVELPRMAEVLGASPEQIQKIADSMGLPPHRPISEHQQRRGYVSLIRRNWHLLPYNQMLTLLGWDADRLAHVLKEEDFLWFKLGMLKPKCPPLRYTEPTTEQEQRARPIREIVERHFGRGALTAPMQPRFAFVDELSRPLEGVEIKPRPADEPIRFLYSYFALYGDPLSDPTLDPYPDGLLQRLAAAGVNGVWLHTILRELAPSSRFPEFGEGHKRRLENLRGLVRRCARYGIKVYLYMNEPRSMPDAFFKKYPEIAGHRDEIQGSTAMCTSVPVVREFMHDALAHVFREAPGLGGAFNITMVENLTNCYSRAHGQPPNCPRCAARTPQQVIAEVNRTIAEGIHAGDSSAKVLIWDWVWENAWAEEIINALPDNVYLMSVSEWDLPIRRGGVETVAGEYSLSAVGPGPRATRNWKIARQRGLKTVAKIQVNCSWELSVLPYLPVMDLVSKHLVLLRDAGVSGFMLSWTLGGYPSPNLELVERLGAADPLDEELVLRQLAEERFGPRAAPAARGAWRAFSNAFSEYPFHIVQLYNSPVQMGPANPLFPRATGYQSTMVGFPYDDLDHWRAVYPAEVFAAQFEKLARGWYSGVELLEQAMFQAEQANWRRNAQEDLRIAQAAYTHFQSTANQTRFTESRNLLASGSLAPDLRRQHLIRMRAAAESEIQQARRLFDLTRQDARIGFEATNHYNYYPLDFVEKIINCEYILHTWLPRQAAQ